MKLAFAVFKYFPFGGMQRNMLAIAKECLENGHNVVIYTGEWHGDHEAGLKVQILPVKGFSNHQRNRNFAEVLGKSISQSDYDLVVGFNKMPGLDVYYAGDSCFAAKAYEDKSALYRMTSRSKMSLSYEEAVFSKKSATDILLVSELERQVYERYYQTQGSRFFPLPPGISRHCIMTADSHTIRINTRKQLGINDNEYLLLALGSGFRTKGLDRSVQLLSQLKKKMPVRLIIVGQDKKTTFQRMAKKMGVLEDLQFLGGRKDVPAILQAADILLHPAYRENTGNVLLEAMVAGLPVVATDACGYAHYIDSANMGAVLPAPFSSNSYCFAVEKILQQPRSEWQQRGKLFAKNADIYSRPKRVVEIIEKIAGARHV